MESVTDVYNLKVAMLLTYQSTAIIRELICVCVTVIIWMWFVERATW